MPQKFDADMNIIAQSDAEIQIDPITKDMNIIQKLDDEPNDVGGLSAQALKAKFDEGGIAIKDYINNSLIPQILSEGATEAQRQANEAQRQANEAQRQANETQRQEHEEAREVWENFDRNKTYVPGNKVYYSGSSYVNRHSCSGILPTDTYYWQMIAKKGDDGDSLADLDERYLKLSGGTVTGSLRVTGDSLTTGESGFNQQPGKSTPIYINGPSLKDGLINPSPSHAEIKADVYMSVGPYGERYEGDFLRVGGRSLLIRKDLFMDGQNIRNLGEPTMPSDAVNKQYVDNIVRNANIPSSTVSVPAADLPAYINALPRLLTEHLVINTSGEVNAYQMNVYGFFGSGSLTIQPAENQSAVFKTRMYVSGCSVPVYLKNIQFVDPIPGVEENRNALNVLSWSKVYLDGCSFASENGGSSHVRSFRGLNVSEGSFLRAYNMRADHCGVVILLGAGGIAILHAENANDMHDNYLGAYIYESGLLMLGGQMPNTLGGSSNAKYDGGAIIVASNSTLI